jgi:hypothetical protein
MWEILNVLRGPLVSLLGMPLGSLRLVNPVSTLLFQ